jgi:hypothetical protein
MRRGALWLLLTSLTLVIGAQGAFSQQKTDLTSAKSVTPVGIWESDEGTGAVGINLWEAPSSDEHGGPVPSGEDGNKPILLIGVYQRSNATLRCGEENFYDTGWRGVANGASSNYAQGRLTVSNPGRFRSAVTMDLDLRFDPVRDVWIGRFHRGTFDKFLTLHRAPNRDDHDGGICPISGPNPLVR